MFKWLRTKLGFDYIRNECDYIASQLANQADAINELKSQITIHDILLARVIAKNEPIFGVPETDPQRKAESDRIGNEIIERLKAEDRARKHTLGEL